MSTLGDEIRAQKRRADLLSDELAQSASDLRATMSTTHWTSGSADQCRRVLAEYADTLDRRSRGASSFAEAIDAHARAVESHEASIAAAAVAAVESAKKGLSKIGDALHRDERLGPFDYSHHGDWRG